MLSANHEKYEPLFTLQNLQWKVVSCISRLNSSAKALQKRWQTQSELHGVWWRESDIPGPTEIAYRTGTVPVKVNVRTALPFRT